MRSSIVPFLYSKCTAAARSPGSDRVMDDRSFCSRFVAVSSQPAVNNPTIYDLAASQLSGGGWCAWGSPNPNPNPNPTLTQTLNLCRMLLYRNYTYPATFLTTLRCTQCSQIIYARHPLQVLYTLYSFFLTYSRQLYMCMGGPMQCHAGSALAPRGGVVGDVVEVDPAAVVDGVLEALRQRLGVGVARQV